MPRTDSAPRTATLAEILNDRHATPGPRPPLGARAKYALVIRRFEFLPGYVPQAVVPGLLGAASWGQLGSLNAVLAMLWSISGLQVANMANALADREQDRRLKSRQSRAVYGLGVTRVVLHTAVSTLVYAAVAAFLAIRTHHWDLLGYAAAFLFIGFAYSLPPLHLKSRGIWHLLSLQTGCMLLPGIAILRAYDHATPWAHVWTLTGFAMVVTSLFVTSHCEDYVVDGQFGTRTYVRALGLAGALYLQSAMLFLGSLLLLGAIWAIDGPTWGFVPYAVAWLPSQRLLFAAVRVVHRVPLDEAMDYFHRKSLHGPYHSALMSWATVALAALVLTGR
ncbi:UbiA family prenyltransferase [Streptomyces luteireticuli]|uniref:Prenyltransferase n=1 Tax=Streptomyces luteireticuli TaxID=173858 RepID=A0ABN0YHW6_9ACTN